MSEHERGSEPLTVPAVLRRAVEAFGERDAVVAPDARVTFAQLDEASRRVARALVAAGVGKGTRVAAQFSYGAPWLVALLAVTRVGGVFVPLSTAYKPAELRKTLRHADVALLLSPRRLFGADRVEYLTDALPELRADAPVAGRLRLREAPFLRAVWVEGGADVPWAARVDLGPSDAAGGTAGVRATAAGGDGDVSDELLAAIEAEITPADVALTIYTSGTTAEPKGVVHTHGALTRKTWANLAAKGISADDRVFCGMPFFWVGGLMQGVMRALASGGTLLCLERPDPEAALDLMEREQATHLIGWPGVTGPILAHPSAPSRRIPALAGPVGRRAGLGMTETLAGYSSSATVTSVPPGERGACMGRVNEQTELKVVDPDTGAEVPDGISGALLVRGWCVMAGLHKREREETFTADGWYDTGDKGYLKDGLLFFEGRYTEMIKTSGSNVAPPEVEAVLRALPDVADAHVLGIPDAERGQVVAAAVVPAGGSDLDPDDVRDRVRRELSNYKVPRRVVVVPAGELPTLANGKPDRLAIRALLEKGGT